MIMNSYPKIDVLAQIVQKHIWKHPSTNRIQTKTRKYAYVLTIFYISLNSSFIQDQDFNPST